MSSSTMDSGNSTKNKMDAGKYTSKFGHLHHFKNFVTSKF